ncbi:glutathione S-transferase, partial [Ochromonadaceae sp. CCMP2298]
ESGVRLTQMHAILFYLADKHDLNGRSSADIARAVMISEGLRDWINQFFDVTYCNAPWLVDVEPDVHVESQSQAKAGSPRFLAASEKYVEESLPVQLSIFSNLLTKSEGGIEGGTRGPWLLGPYLSFPDFILAEYLMQHLIFRPSCLVGFPALQDYVNRFRELPAVSAYLAGEKYQVEPIHNRYSHFHRGWT